MAGGAVAPPRVFKHRQAPGFPQGEPGLAAQIGVVLAAVGIEVLGLLLKGFQGQEGGLDQGLGPGFHLRAEKPHQGGPMGALAELGGQGGDIPIGHFIGGEEGNGGLIVEGRGPAVPGKAPRGALVLAIPAIVVEKVLAEGG